MRNVARLIMAHYLLAAPYSADYSWSGYSYQGCVALYLVIKTFNDATHPNAKDYQLELEYVEDIGIRDAMQNFISIHQVKTSARPTMTTLAEALWRLIAKAVTYNTSAYIHVVTTMDSTYWATLKEHMPKGHEAECTRLINAGSFEQGSSMLSVYSYSGQMYCSIAQIHGLIEDELETYKSLNGLEFDCRTMRWKLLDIINVHILQRHHARQQGTTPIRTIGFGEFWTALHQPTTSTEEYKVLCELKDLIAVEGDKFVSYCEGQGQPVSDEFWRILQAVNALEIEQFLSFSQKTNPHIRVRQSLTSRNIFQPFDAVGVPTLLKIFSQLSGLDTEKFYYHHREGTIYCPTTLFVPNDGDLREYRINTIARDILNNAAVSDVFYDVGKFVSSGIDIDLHDFLWMVVSPDEGDQDHITRMGPKRIVSINTAKRELGIK